MSLSSRESIPFADDSAEGEDNFGHRLKLSFSKLPKNVNHGFVFGWGPDCDIQLVDRKNLQPGDRDKVKNVSQRHFSITFDAQRGVILRDTSTNGTTVSYDAQAKDEIRSYFTWIIFPGFKTIEASIPSAELSFKIQLGSHDSCEAQFFANVDAVLPQRLRTEDSMLASPIMQLNMRSRDTSVAASGAGTPRHGPIYLLRKQIGKGTFGKVYTVIDVSTGNQYAGKSFFEQDYKLDREVAIMKEVKHVSIFGCTRWICRSY